MPRGGPVVLKSEHADLRETIAADHLREIGSSAGSLASSSGIDEGGESSRAGEKGASFGNARGSGERTRGGADFSQVFRGKVVLARCHAGPGANELSPASAQVRWVPGRRRNAGPTNHDASRRVLLLALQPVPAKRRGASRFRSSARVPVVRIDPLELPAASSIWRAPRERPLHGACQGGRVHFQVDQLTGGVPMTTSSNAGRA